MIYLDHAASTPLVLPALQMLHESSEGHFANPSAKHTLGVKAKSKVEEARKIIIEHFGGEGRFDLVFTSGATESNNIFIQSFKYKKKARFFLGDHPAITLPVSNFYESLEQLSLDQIFVGQFEGVIAVSYTNGQSGECIDLEDIKKFKEQNRDCLIFLDCSQAFGKLPLLQSCLKKYHQFIDGISLSAHKMGGPKGIGALLFKKNLKLSPLTFGGGQENGIRPGTIATPLILSWAQAVSKREKDFSLYLQMETLDKKLKELLNENLGDAIVWPLNPRKKSPFVTSFVLKGIPSDIIIRHLEEKEIYISSSSACSSKIEGFNPVFLALGIPVDLHKNVLRVSLNYETTLLEIEIFVAELSAIYKRLAKLFLKK